MTLKLIGDKRSAIERTGGAQLTWCGKPTLQKLPFGRVAALVDGTVVLFVDDGHGAEFVYELTAEQALEMVRPIQHAAIAARERVQKLAGRGQWRAMKRDGAGFVLMRSWPDGKSEERWFEPGKVGVKRSRSAAFRAESRGITGDECAGCRKDVPPGSVVYRPCKDDIEKYEYDSQRHIRICEACATPQDAAIRRVK